MCVCFMSTITHEVRVVRPVNTNREHKPPPQLIAILDSRSKYRVEDLFNLSIQLSSDQPHSSTSFCTAINLSILQNALAVKPPHAAAECWANAVLVSFFSSASEKSFASSKNFNFS